MGRYFYRPQPMPVDQGYAGLATGLAGGVEAGVGNFMGEQQHLREEARQSEADRWAKARNLAWLSAMGGGQGHAPSDTAGSQPAPQDAPPALDFGKPGMEAGTEQKHSPLSQFGGPAAALTKGPRSADAESYVDQPPPGPATPGKHYAQLGDVGYIRDPRELAGEEADTQLSRKLKENSALADQAWSEQQAHIDQQATEMEPELRRRMPNASPDEVHAQARSIVSGEAKGISELYPKPYDPDTDPVLGRAKYFVGHGLSGQGAFPRQPLIPRRDYNQPSFDQLYAKNYAGLMQGYAIRDKYSGQVTGYKKTPSEIADEAAEQTRKILGGGHPTAHPDAPPPDDDGSGHGQAPPPPAKGAAPAAIGMGDVRRSEGAGAGQTKIERAGQDVHEPGDPAPKGGKSFQSYAGVQGPTAQSSGLSDDDVNELRSALDQSGIDPSQWEDALRQDGSFSDDEIEQIIQGG